jgi:hypothetical protein
MAIPTPGSTRQTAGAIYSYPTPQSFSDSLTQAAPTDFYKFTLTRSSLVSFTLAGTSTTRLRLTDNGGEPETTITNAGVFQGGLDAGTYYIQVDSTDGTPPPPSQLAYAINNFSIQSPVNNGLAWRNDSDGRNSIWLLNGVSRSLELALPRVGPEWYVAAKGDFDGDEVPDVVWRNRNTGRTDIWYLDISFLGVVTYTSKTLAAVPADWNLVGAGLFNDDGTPDLVWQNRTSGRTDIWYMGGSDGATRVSSTTIVSSIDAAWRIESVGDLDGNGSPDLFWYNSANGRHDVWFMGGASNTTRTGSQTLLTSTAWRVEGLFDLGGDGRPNIVWRNPSQGRTDVWTLGGSTNTTFVSSQSISPPVTNAAWRAIPVDFPDLI